MAVASGAAFIVVAIAVVVVILLLRRKKANSAGLISEDGLETEQSTSIEWDTASQLTEGELGHQYDNPLSFNALDGETFDGAYDE
jgi:hypothetical protein